MTPDQFVTDAIRTESKVQRVVVNPYAYEDLKSAIINLGNVLDHIKKNVFYEKPIDVNDTKDCLYRARVAVHKIEDDTVLFNRFPNKICESPCNVNPRLFHSIVGIMTEACELLQALNLWTDQIDVVNVREEFGDLLWYIAIGVDETGGSLDQVMDRVIEKLRIRYPEKFTSEQAINRDIDKERQVLEAK